MSLMVLRETLLNKDHLEGAIWRAIAESLELFLDPVLIKEVEVFVKDQTECVKQKHCPTWGVLVRPLAGFMETEQMAKVPSNGPWSKPNGPAQWAKRFGVHVSTIKRRFEKQTIRNKQITTKSYIVHVDDLPGDAK